MPTNINENQSEFAAFVGIDWADRKHACAVQSADLSIIEYGEIEHTPEAVEAWAIELARRFSQRPVAVALEQVRGALMFMLTKYEHLVVFPVHPATLVNYRKSFRRQGRSARCSTIA